MPPDSLLLTKLTPPPLRPGLLPRLALLQRLDDLLAPGARLGLVCASAGYGKTTLVSAWLAAHPDLPAAWLSLDENDAAPTRFYLTELQKMTLVQYNPSILNNIDIMNELNQELTDDQKYDLSKKVDAKQINNTDSKVLFRKWSMSAEERAEHDQTSFYVFLSNPDQFIEKLVKVDPLDPESYRVINMMKLRKQVQPNTSMYGIKTEAGLLDDYIGKSSDDIGSSALEGIKQKSQKI